MVNEMKVAANADRFVTKSFQSGVTVKIAKDLKPVFHDFQNGDYDLPIEGDYVEMEGGKRLEIPKVTGKNAFVSIDETETPIEGIEDKDKPEIPKTFSVKVEDADIILNTKDGAQQFLDITAKNGRVGLMRDKSKYFSDTIDFEGDGKTFFTEISK